MLPIVPAQMAPIAEGLAMPSWSAPALRLTNFELAFAILELAFAILVIVMARRVEDAEHRRASANDGASHLPRAA